MSPSLHSEFHPAPVRPCVGKERANCLEVEDVTVRFGTRVVLRHLSFTIPEGTSLAIIGPNGAGKTILLKALIGGVPYEGRIRWADGTRIGYVPQKIDIERDLPITGEDFVRAKAAVTGATRDDSTRALALARVDPDLARRPIGVLSGGQFQRMLVALALVGRPTVLLLDEPTAGVDEPGQESLNDAIDRLRIESGLTVLLVSHDVSVVYRYASNVLCLGRASACLGPPKTVLTPALLEELYGAPVRYHVHDGTGR